MKNNLLLLLLLFLPLSMLAQKAVLPSGGAATGNGSISYSVGEITYLTLTGENGSVSSGIQQPFEISVVLDTPEAKTLTLVAYPNPATEFVLLRSDGTLPKAVYGLFDTNGKLLSNGKFDHPEIKIDMSRLAPSVYFLKISSDDRILKTFRILKK